MSGPVTVTNKHGKTFKIGDLQQIVGEVTAINPTTGVVTLRLLDAYINTTAGLATVNVQAYQLG
jgi:hypothetical protein